MAFEMTIIKGLTQDGITKLAALNNTVEKRFEQTDIRLDGVDAHLESLDTRLGCLEMTTATIQITLTQILERLPEKP
ncbi:MAG TPA: hypothetical protein VGM01_12415 [Ktedonobacteraceae bacterium]|jgi:hypothetical protein